jgi:hypothetical protein
MKIYFSSFLAIIWLSCKKKRRNYLVLTSVVNKRGIQINVWYYKETQLASKLFYGKKNPYF